MENTRVLLEPISHHQDEQPLYAIYHFVSNKTLKRVKHKHHWLGIPLQSDTPIMTSKGNNIVHI